MSSDQASWKLKRASGSYCWWTKSCTTKDDDYPIMYRVLTIPGGAGFLPSTVALDRWRLFLFHLPAARFFFQCDICVCQGVYQRGWLISYLLGSSILREIPGKNPVTHTIELVFFHANFHVQTPGPPQRCGVFFSPTIVLLCQVDHSAVIMYPGNLTLPKHFELKGEDPFFTASMVGGCEGHIVVVWGLFDLML